MYQVRWQHKDPPDEGLPSEQRVGSIGKSVKLKTNCFRINWNEDSSLHRYHYELPNPEVSREKELEIVEEVWSTLRTNMEHFVVRRPGLIFSPKLVKDFAVPLKSGGEVKISYVARTPGDQVNAGLLGPAAVVGQHIVNKLAEPFKIQKVGKRYYSNCPQANKGSQVVINGFCVNMLNLNSSGPMMQLDVVHRPLSQKKMTEVLSEICQGNESDVWAFHTDKDVMAEWMRFCENATVVTQYNSRVYRIKAVHFDKTPADEFTMYRREAREYTKITYLKYFEAFYNMRPQFHNQPLLEAFPEKANEEVFLLPELCVQTGITEDMRKDKNTMQEALKSLKAAPQERLSAIIAHATDMQKDRPATAVKAWGCSLNTEPVEVSGRVLEPLQVAFQEKKVYPVEEGNFTKLLRNGLQCAVKLDDWILVYPSTDEGVLDIWLRSLRDIAQVAFGMQLVEPRRIKLEQQLEELDEALKREVQPTTQLVLMLIPAKDSPKLYQRFKEKMITALPCISQVVRSETIRKRQQIAAILSKVVLQINAKFSGPLWNITVGKDADKDIVAENLKSAPFSILGVDVHRNNMGERTLAMTATLDKSYSQYFSMSAMLDKDDWQSSLLQKIQTLFRSALLCFSSANHGILPEKIVIYRAAVHAEAMDQVSAEVQAMQEVLDVLVKGTFGRAPEDRPKVTCIAIARRGNMRIFAPCEEKVFKNPETGTVVDDPAICPNGVPSFYLVSQAISKGSAIPSFYSVLLNENNFSMDVIQNLTYRLCLMFYNSSAAVRVPAPVMYAMKLAKMIGTVVKKAPHPALQRSLFYL